MLVEFSEEARQDLFDGFEYYGSKESGLGRRFANEIADILTTVASSPFLWRERDSGYRRVNCPLFPFYIAYIILDETIVVVAIASNHREPGYWHKRLT